MKKPYLVLLFAFCVWLVASIHCSKDYNPFHDYDNAGLYLVSQSIHNNDTVSIFSTESLLVDITAKELVDSVRIFIPGNRLWHNADSVLSTSAFEEAPIPFLISWYDTGMHSIVFTVHKKNNSLYEETLSVYAKSPLHQNIISLVARDSIVLKTPKVKDNDVMYYWSFGNQLPIVSPVCSTKAAIIAPIVSGFGRLWVWDGNVSSPKDSFPFILWDTTAPSIRCINDNYSSNDTIYTSDSLFTFRVQISDDFNGFVDSASVNGRAFDGRSNDSYFKLFDGAYSYSQGSPLLLSVFAMDHFKNGNSTKKTFYLVYSSFVPHSNKLDIVFESPVHDSLIVTTPLFLFSGTIVNHSLDSLDVRIRAYVNNVVLAQEKILHANSQSWDWNCPLVTGKNVFRVIAMDNATGAVYDQKEATVFLTSDTIDTVPPRILAVNVDGSPAQGLYTDKPTIIAAIEAFDEGSGIDSLFINGILKFSASFWYYDTIALRHTISGNELAVLAIDKKKNRAYQSVVIYKNQIPVVQKAPKSLYVFADSLYSDSLYAFDPDNDTITYQKVQGPPGLSVFSTGKVQWSPSRSDSGANVVTIRVWDGYQPVFVSFTLFVNVPGKPLPQPVAFATQESDFPLFLTAGKDSLTLALQLKSNTGIAPFSYSCRIIGKKTSIFENSPNNVINWKPTLPDTGYCQFIVIVKDNFPASDTLYPRILVVPENRPCSIAVAYHTPTDSLANGALNLNSQKGPFRIVFKIFDPDNPIVQRHDVELFQTRTHTTSSFDSALVDTFGYTVDPTTLLGFDTITATVHDANTSAAAMVRLYYGTAPGTPQQVFPLNFSKINQSDVRLQYACADVDNDSLSYDIFVGDNPLGLMKAGTSSSTGFTVYGLAPSTTYYWQIICKDWKSQTSGPLWQFSTGP